VKFELEKKEEKRREKERLEAEKREQKMRKKQQEKEEKERKAMLKVRNLLSFLIVFLTLNECSRNKSGNPPKYW
jgi:hypothetical protein